MSAFERSWAGETKRALLASPGFFPCFWITSKLMRPVADLGNDPGSGSVMPWPPEPPVPPAGSLPPAPAASFGESEVADPQASMDPRDAERTTVGTNLCRMSLRTLHEPWAVAASDDWGSDGWPKCWP